MSMVLTEPGVPRKGTAAPGSRGARRLLVEFGPGILDQIRAMAVYKDMPVTVMVRGWIVDRLRDEQRRIGWEPQRPGEAQEGDEEQQQGDRL